MGRKRKIDTNELIAIIDEYHFNYPNKKIKASDIGEYARNQGLNVTDINVRRNELARQHIDEINNLDDEERYNVCITYAALDVDGFIANNRSPQKLKNALIERESYYASIANAAVKFKKDKELLEDSNRKLRQQLIELTDKVEKLKVTSKDSKQKDELIAHLKRTITNVVNPEIAKTLLKEKGVFEYTSDIVTNEAIKERTIDCNTNIQKFSNKALKNILEDFDEDNQSK